MRKHAGCHRIVIIINRASRAGGALVNASLFATDLQLLRTSWAPRAKPNAGVSRCISGGEEPRGASFVAEPKHYSELGEPGEVNLEVTTS